MTEELKIAELLKDDLRMQKLEHAILRIAEAVDSLSHRTERLSNRVSEVTEKAEEGAQSTNKTLNSLFKTLDEVKKTGESAFMGMADLAIPKSIKALMQLNDALKGVGNTFAGITTGMRSLQNGAESYVNSMITRIPYIGNFLGLMFDAQKRVADYEASGRTAVLQLRQSGPVSSGLATEYGNALGGRMDSWETGGLASRGQVSGAFAAAARAGYGQAEALNKLGPEFDAFKKLGSEAVLVALNIDQAFDLSAGTTIGWADQLGSLTGQALPDSLSLIRDIGSAAYSMGVNMDRAVGAITQVTQSLRTQGASGRDLLEVMLKMRTGFGGAGLKDRAASEMAIGALGSLGNFVSGMDSGLQAYIGRDVARRMGVTGRGGVGIDQLDDLAILRGMNMGFRPGLSGFQGGSKMGFEEAAGAAWYGKGREQFSSDDDLYAFLTMGPARMDPALAQLMIQTRGLSAGGGETEKARAQYEKILAEQAGQEPLKKSSFDAQMDKIQKLMRDIAMASLATLTGILRGVLSLGEGLATFAKTGKFPSTQLGRTYSEIGGSISSAWGNIADTELTRVLAPALKGLGYSSSGGQFGGTFLSASREGDKNVGLPGFGGTPGGSDLLWSVATSAGSGPGAGVAAVVTQHVMKRLVQDFNETMSRTDGPRFEIIMKTPPSSYRQLVPGK